MPELGLRVAPDHFVRVAIRKPLSSLFVGPEQLYRWDEHNSVDGTHHGVFVDLREVRRFFAVESEDFLRVDSLAHSLEVEVFARQTEGFRPELHYLVRIPFLLSVFPGVQVFFCFVEPFR